MQLGKVTILILWEVEEIISINNLKLKIADKLRMELKDVSHYRSRYGRALGAVEVEEQSEVFTLRRSLRVLTAVQPRTHCSPTTDSPWSNRGPFSTAAPLWSLKVSRHRPKQSVVSLFMAERMDFTNQELLMIAVLLDEDEEWSSTCLLYTSRCV